MKSDSGFTLLELVIGIAILGVMLVLLFSAFRLATDTWDRVDRETLHNTEQLAGREFVRRLVSALQPVRWKKAANQELAFWGDTTTLRGLSQVSAHAGIGGLRIVELSSVSATSSNGVASISLLLRQAPLDRDAEVFFSPLDQATPRVVLQNLSEAKFMYYGVAKSGEQAQWFDSWPNPEHLPQLVRLQLRAKDGGWGSILIAPQVNGFGCHWNAFYKKCLER